MVRLLEEVELILARSPQAKGRIERLWGPFQDRLTSELRLQGVSTLEEANRVLAQHLVRHNRRFAVVAKQRFDGTLRVFHEGRCLATTPSQLLPGPLRLSSFTKSELPIPTPKPSPQRLRRSTLWKPAANHPWKAAWTQLG